jgi:hypothetical protein
MRTVSVEWAYSSEGNLQLMFYNFSKYQITMVAQRGSRENVVLCEGHKSLKQLKPCVSNEKQHEFT